MNSVLLSKVESPHLKLDLPELNIGDTIKLGLKVREGKTGTRIQYFQGILIRKSGSGIRLTITVRKIGANGVGVEKILPVHAPVLDSIEVIKNAKVRRAKLYYIRSRIGKAATNV